MDELKVSVVVPVYNLEDYIEMYPKYIRSNI